MNHGDMAGYGWIWMTLGLALWISIFALDVRAVAGQRPYEPTAPSADEILRRRYANREISRIEYEAARRALGAADSGINTAPGKGEQV
jgi:uncharacterized membrane protein